VLTLFTRSMYDVHMGRHPKKDVAKALEAAGETFTVRPMKGHAWGFLICDVCGQKMSIWSTPKSPSSHAKRIREFITKHDHQSATGETP